MGNEDNRPFMNLDCFVRDNMIRLRNISEMQHPENKEDDTVVFTDAMKDVRIVLKKKKTIKRKPPGPFASGRYKSKEDVLFKDIFYNHLNVSTLPEFMEGFIEGINPLTLEKLRTGEYSVQKTLDLHGFSVDDAAELFDDFMRTAIRDGLKCVKIIHGRGLKSKKTPILRESLKSWIIKAMHRKWVIAFSNAIMAEGGPGATYILLKKHPKKKPMRIVG